MTYNSKKTKNKFTKMTIELVSLTTDKFNCDELIEVLKQIRFDLINVNLLTAKENVNLNGHGFTPIGFVNKFYSNEEDNYVFDIAISSKFAEAVENLKTEDLDLGITARVFTNKNGNITKIIGLDLTPVVK